MNKFDNTVKQIKEVKIQGAEAVAKAGIEAYMLRPNNKRLRILVNIRPTEPMLQNILKCLNWQSKKSLQKKAKQILKYIEESHKHLAGEGAKLIKSNMNIFTHCHSSSVVDILKTAKKQKKKFQVFITETRPLLQGRLTARELARAKIKVTYFSDFAAAQFLEKADMLLIGADAYTKGGLINKIGTATLAKLAYKKIPVYSAGLSLKYAKKVKIEKRKPSEVWREKYKQIEVENPAFDLTPRKYLTAIISELGILKYGEFIKKARKIVKEL